MNSAFWRGFRSVLLADPQPPSPMFQRYLDAEALAGDWRKVWADFENAAREVVGEEGIEPPSGVSETPSLTISRLPAKDGGVDGN